MFSAVRFSAATNQEWCLFHWEDITRICAPVRETSTQSVSVVLPEQNVELS